MGDRPATTGVSGYGYEASEVPEVERKEFVTKVRVGSRARLSYPARIYGLGQSYHHRGKSLA